MAELKCVVCDSVLSITERTDEENSWCLECSSCDEIQAIVGPSLDMVMHVFLNYQQGWRKGYDAALEKHQKALAAYNVAVGITEN